MALATQTQVAGRTDQLRKIQHSLEMEGLTVDRETLEDGETYAAGKITVDELVQRTRARYGLT